MFYIGSDVSKARLDCYLLSVDQAKGKSKVVSNDAKGCAELVAWLAKHGVLPASAHIVMEGTGVYHERAALTLHEAGLVVSIVNPAQIRDFAKGLAIRTKTDGVDSMVLARYGALVKPPRWQPPPVTVRQLQSLLARREAVAQDLQRERNRQEKSEVALEAALVHESLHDSIAFLEQQLVKLQREIDDHIDRYPDLKGDLALLQSIPAVGPQVSRTMLAVIHSHSFRSAEQLAAFLGLVPIERQSGSSLSGRARLSKAGPARVRATLYMAAVVAIRHNPHVRALYDRLLLRGKSKMAALGAAMRKIVHLCFGVIHTQQPYSASWSPATA